MSWEYYPKEFSSYEEYVKYLKEKGLALEAPEGIYKTRNRTDMTREEQIREASIDYQMSTSPRVIGGDAFADMARKMNVNPSFIAGAKWADKTIEEETELVAKWFEHIAQIAEDRKTANGEVMEDWAVLDEIRALATDSAYYVRKHLQA